MLDTEVSSQDHAAPTSEALALRYRVYCEEFGYLSAADYPLGQETDTDDLRSVHFHRYAAQAHATGDTGNLAGYVRLVRPDADGLLPVQRRCTLNAKSGRQIDPSLCAEVSRLIIAPEFRRPKRGRGAELIAISCEEQAAGHRPSSTDVLLHLFRQMLVYSQAHGIRYWYAAMERPLARSLAQMGFPFQVAGAEGEFFGRVTPYVVDLQDLQVRVAARQPRLARWLLAQPERAGTSAVHSKVAASHPSQVQHAPPPPQHWRLAS